MDGVKSLEETFDRIRYSQHAFGYRYQGQDVEKLVTPRHRKTFTTQHPGQLGSQNSGRDNRVLDVRSGLAGRSIRQY